MLSLYDSFEEEEPNENIVLYVNDIYKTIQGEGEYVGKPAVFVRLQGCDVGCSWCDSKNTWKKGGKPMTIREIADEVNGLCEEAIDCIWLTGGEPCQQSGTYQLMKFLDYGRFLFAVETSLLGEFCIEMRLFDHVIFSPKFHYMEKYKEMIEARKEEFYYNEIKAVIENEQDIESLDMLIELLYNHGYIERGERLWFLRVQPVWGNKESLEICKNYCLEKGYNLSLQMHKYIGLK